jgi:rhodanese-related sulfurtransferase
MDGNQKHSITPVALGESLGRASAPRIIDVRRAPAFEADEWMIAGAIRRPPEDVAGWADQLAKDRPAVVYCVHGHEVSQNAAAALRAKGLDARYLAGGIEGWKKQGLPCRRKVGSTPGTWVTRERPKIDRIACPWLIRRFIDPEATFLYVPSKRVLATAEETGAVPFDVPGVEFSHVDDRCSFDAFLRIYGIADPALDRLALIVRGADTSRLDLTPQSAGLHAISLGLAAIDADDHAMLEHGMIVYDALYAWCRSLQGETQARPPAM